MKPARSFLMLAAVLAAAGIVVARTDQGQPASVNDIMITIITPATNLIWEIEDPRTDEEWQVFVDAASQVEEAVTRIKAGGGGPNDVTWAQDPEWQRFADLLIESAKEARQAAEGRNLDAFIEISNEKMYPPCEECHIKFHPAMQEPEVN